MNLVASNNNTDLSQCTKISTSYHFSQLRLNQEMCNPVSVWQLNHRGTLALSPFHLLFLAHNVHLVLVTSWSLDGCCTTRHHVWLSEKKGKAKGERAIPCKSVVPFYWESISFPRIHIQPPSLLHLYWVTWPPLHKLLMKGNEIIMTCWDCNNSSSEAGERTYFPWDQGIATLSTNRWGEWTRVAIWPQIRAETYRHWDLKANPSSC